MRQQLLDEIKFFLDSQAKEQSATLKVDLPTLEHYRNYRMGTGAVGVLLAMNQ